MKKTSVVSICGIFSAMSVVIMLAAYFQFLTYALPAIAGALLVLINIELGTKNALSVYIVVSIISFLLCEKEAMLCYVLFFGYYPIIKAYLEKIRSKALQMITKLLIFVIAFTVVFVLAQFVFGIPFDDMGIYGIYSYVFLAMAFVVMFIVYDYALTRVISLYFYKYQPRFRKLFKIKSK